MGTLSPSIRVLSVLAVRAFAWYKFGFGSGTEMYNEIILNFYEMHKFFAEVQNKNSKFFSWFNAFSEYFVSFPYILATFERSGGPTYHKLRN